MSACMWVSALVDIYAIGARVARAPGTIWAARAAVTRRDVITGSSCKSSTSTSNREHSMGAAVEDVGCVCARTPPKVPPSQQMLRRIPYKEMLCNVAGSHFVAAGASAAALPHCRAMSHGLCGHSTETVQRDARMDN